MRKRTEALVVGAGPVGQFTALALARRGVDVSIVDREWRKAAYSYALALHPASLDLMSEAGLARELVANGYRVETMSFWDGEAQQASIDFSALPSPWPFLLIMPQNAIEGLLQGALGELRVPVEWSHCLSHLEVTGGRACATVERREKVSSGYATATTEWTIQKVMEIDPDFVVGADGNRSIVRRRMGIPYREFASPAYYAVFEFETDWDARNEARVVLAPDGGTHVFWPLPGDRCRMSFELGGEEAAAGMREKSRLAVQLADRGYSHLPESELLRLLDEHAPWFGGGVKALRWSLVVRFETRIAESFGSGRVWLAGDSAHLANPVGVASMNVGFREGDDLARRIHEVVRGGLPLTRLEEYGRERLEEWERLVAPGGGFRPGEKANDFVREHAARIPALLPASGAHLTLLADQLGLEPA